MDAGRLVAPSTTPEIAYLLDAMLLPDYRAGFARAIVQQCRPLLDELYDIEPDDENAVLTSMLLKQTTEQEARKGDATSPSNVQMPLLVMLLRRGILEGDNAPECAKLLRSAYADYHAGRLENAPDLKIKPFKPLALSGRAQPGFGARIDIDDLRELHTRIETTVETPDGSTLDRTPWELFRISQKFDTPESQLTGRETLNFQLVAKHPEMNVEISLGPFEL